MKRDTKNIKSKYDAVFRKEITRLNPAQKEAVENIEGPVLVVAGPGTGKTHILSARIGQILEETDTAPHNILCLTYTDAGVHAMRKRLLEFIGPEAHRVHINTFHSFCNNVIKDNLSMFGLQDLEATTELERMEIIGDILDNIDKSNPLRNLKGDHRVWDKKVVQLYDTMKKENWTPELISEKIDAYIEELPKQEEFQYKVNYKQFKKGDAKIAKILEKKKKLENLRAAANLLPTYRKRMEEAHRYDFADMILWVLKAFRENENLLLSYQEQYLYFLVDEFQDTNGAQSELIRMLISYWEQPNIFVVGDDDQSIYEFQGARVRNLVEFYESFDGKILPIVLTTNYRSSQHILDVAKSLIDYNKIRLIHQFEAVNVSKELVAGNEAVANSPLVPRVVAYPNSIHEITDIARQIASIQQQKIPLSDVAVIYTKHKQARQLIQLLQKRNIPYQTKRRVNVLEAPAIKKLLTMLNYLLTEFERPDRGEEYLYEILHYDFTKINPADITKLAVYKGRNAEALPWRELIGNEKLLLENRVNNTAPIIQLYEFWMRIKADYINLPLLPLLERIINRSGMLAYLSQRPDRVYQIQLLHTFFDFVRSEVDKKEDYHVFELLDIINRMKENSIELGIQKTTYSQDGGVNLITGHSSKGLEFRYVFMLDCGKDWEPGSRGRAKFTLPDTLTLSGSEDDLEASRRLFYVAITRAKEHLQISYPEANLKGKPLSPAVFVEELFSHGKLEREERFIEANELSDAEFLLMTEMEEPEIKEKLSKTEVDALLENFKLSASSFNQYLNCPLSFYYENVLHVPSTSSEAASYGSAVHDSLEWIFKQMKADPKKQFPTGPEFLAKFKKEMRRQRAHLTKIQFQRRMELGELRLPPYYQTRINTWKKEVDLEREFRNVEWNGIPLTGKVDKIEYLDKERLHIVDYKTSTVKGSKTNKPSKSNPLGGDYWRQVVFYKIMLESFESNHWNVVSGEVDYLEIDKKTQEFPTVRFDITGDDVTLVGDTMKEVYAKIQAHDFYKGCGKKDCKWCQFTKHYAMVDTYSDELREELDD